MNDLKISDMANLPHLYTRNIRHFALDLGGHIEKAAPFERFAAAKKAALIFGLPRRVTYTDCPIISAAFVLFCENIYS